MAAWGECAQVELGIQAQKLLGGGILGVLRAWTVVNEQGISEAKPAGREARAGDTVSTLGRGQEEWSGTPAGSAR